MIKALLRWWDAHPGFYWLLGGASVILLTGWMWRGMRRETGRAGLPAALLLLAVTCAWRWPELLAAHGGPVGEARLIAAAITVAEQTRVTGATVYHSGGPLSSLLLLPTNALGVPLDYFNARLVALLLDWASQLLLFAVLAKRWGAGRALVALAPLVVALAMPGSAGLAAYSPAHVMLFLLCLAGWGVMRAAAHPAPDGQVGGGICMLLLAGINLGLLPWAGREGIGVAAAFVGVWAFGPDWPPGRRRLTLTLGLAGYVVAVGLALTHGVGAWPDFVLGYVQPSTGATAGAEPSTLEWTVLAMAAIAMGTRAVRPALICAWGLLLGAMVVIAFRGGAPRMLGRLSDHWRHPRGEVAGWIHAMQRGGDTLAVWGVAPEIHVETALAAATRGSGAPDAGPARTEFLRDLRKNRPAFFVVVTEPGWPELVDHLREQYRIAGADATGRRLLVRGDRMAESAFGEPGAVPLTVGGLVTAEAFAGVGDIGAGRISAHPPSRLVHPVAPNSAELRGIFGFLPAAYARPAQATDGARFIINWRWAGGRRERALQRYLSPAATADDRDAVQFRLPFPPDRPEEVELIVEPGPTMSYDWVYWGEIRFAPRN